MAVFDTMLFVHIIGLVIGLGAVTVIDSLGFFSRNSVKGTQTTIEAHHTTKPLIWLGTVLVLASWVFLYDGSSAAVAKTGLLVILIANGSFMSFHISPRLDKLSGKNKLLPSLLQKKIAASMMISFIGWWSFVALTVYMIG